MSSRTPIKVVHLASGDRWAGAEVQLYTLLAQLSRSPNIEVRAILLNDGELAKRLRNQNVAVDILDESRLPTATIFRGLVQLLNQQRPHILHTHRQKENILGAVANLFSARARSVRTVHGASENVPKNLSQRLIQLLDRWIGNHLQQRVITVSHELGRKIVHLFKRGHVAVIENGIDIIATQAAINSVEFRESHSDAIHIGIVGRLDRVKRVDIFLDMAATLVREQPDKRWRFHIFGEGALEQPLKTQASALGLNDHARFHGHRSDIIACIAALDSLVMCSDHEGMPMTLLETMCLGTPIIGHDTGGIGELLQHGKNGWPVTDHSAAGYAKAVTQCLQNKSEAQNKIESAKSLIAKYSIASSAEQYLSIYETILRLKNS